MKRKPAKRGRKSGQLKRASVDSGTHPAELAAAASAGSYKNGVTYVIRLLDLLVSTRSRVEIDSVELLAGIAESLPHRPHRPIPELPKPHDQRTDVWRHTWRRSGACLDWLTFLASGPVREIVQILLDAIEKRDALFFRDIAKRLASGDDLRKPAEPALAALAVEKMRPVSRRTLSDTPKVADVQSFLIKHGVRQDERTTRAHMKLAGFKTLRKGRPRDTPRGNAAGDT
jgi:hypothetical protein